MFGSPDARRALRRQLGRQSEEMTGTRALLARAVETAVLDYADGDPLTIGYFAGPIFQHHLAWLDLPSTWLPWPVAYDVAMAQAANV